MKRSDQLNHLNQTDLWDFIIIGGGASGLGAAIDAASRGYKTVLFEGVDFAKGTSSRSTKLVHGGVRYLAQGNVGLVFEALRERGLLSRNAKHLFRKQRFIIPNYSYWNQLFYGVGLKVYDFLSLNKSLGGSRMIGKSKVLNEISSLKADGLKGGVVYYDGQFDDSRLALNMAQTAVGQGATILNYMKVVGLNKDAGGKLTSVSVECQESGEIREVKGKIFINATGVFANKILKMAGRKKKGLKVVPSQGIHLVLDSSFLKSNSAIMIPKTSDGRVLFIIPWKDKAVLGTTDTPINKPSYEPLPLEEEVDFILKTAADYLTHKPERKDVLSVFAGLRPLVAPEGDKTNTKEISRGHQILYSESGLISILGGKWTTYRQMAEDLITAALKYNGEEVSNSKTDELGIYGNIDDYESLPDHLKVYGSDANKIIELESNNSGYASRIHQNYPYTQAQVVWAARHEMARTVEDVLARRLRLLFLDAKAAIEAAPVVSRILASELSKDDEWEREAVQSFNETANKYLLE